MNDQGQVTRAALRSEIGALWRWFPVVLWIAIAGAVAWSVMDAGYDLDELPRLLSHAVSGVGLGPAAGFFVLAACLRPWLLVPTTVIVVAAGFTFGPWLGWALAVLGLNLGALLTWTFGRWVGGGALPRRLARLRVRQAGPWAGFGLVFSARLANLPCDVVSFSAGSLGVPMPGFLLGTALGSLPGVTVLALAGGALSGPDNLRLVLAGAAAALLVALLSWWHARARGSGRKRWQSAPRELNDR